MRIWPCMHNFCSLLFIAGTISRGFEKTLTGLDNGSRMITYLQCIKRYHQLCLQNYWKLQGKDRAKSLLSSSVIISLTNNNNIYVLQHHGPITVAFIKTTGTSDLLYSRGSAEEGFQILLQGNLTTSISKTLCGPTIMTWTITYNYCWQWRRNNR